MDSKQATTLSDGSKADAILGDSAMFREEDDETIDMAFRVNHLYYPGADFRILMEHERENGTLPTRAKQAALYLTFADKRIEELEKELQKVKQTLYDLPDELELRKRRRVYPVYQHLLKRSSPSQFRLGRSSFDVPREERAALEVLIVEHPERKQQSAQPELSRMPISVKSDQVNVHWSPERLRIRSRPLISHLQSVSATRISDNLSVPEKDERETSLVFLRPFKFIVAFEKEIRQSINNVEAALQNQRQEKQKQERPNAGVPLPPRRLLVEEPEFDNQDLLEDLKLLIKFMDEDLKPTFDLRQHIEEGTADLIAYADLWHLFHRGEFVLLQSDPTHAYKVLQFTGGREPLIDRINEDDAKAKPVEGFSVDCLSVQSNGSSYVPELTTVSIPPYLGRVPIRSLAVYPMRSDPDEAAKRERFTEQGRRYLELTMQSYAHKSVVGKTLDEPSHDLDAQVIIDMTLAIHSNPDWRPKTKITLENLTQFDQRETKVAPFCYHNSSSARYLEGCCGSDHAFKDWEMDQIQLDAFVREHGHLLTGRDAKELAGDELMLLPTWIHGFVLRTRRWATIGLADLSEVKFENDFKNLMLPEETKANIQALVETHENSRGGSLPSSTSGSVGGGIDLVQGKGTGLILLLHGAPGVGKTSTAECVADTTRRPLFPVTCGDIGETAHEVERQLQQNFLLAHKWGCVLLLDEADVFLAKRSRNDIRHNAVTSVFLRSLEFYAGILFLTTNRVGHMDPAFKSRINLSLLYHPFNLKSTVRLYKAFIDRTRGEQKKRGPPHFKINGEEIIAFAKENYRGMKRERMAVWNGRQIRNAFQAAISLAEHEYLKKLVDGRYPAKKPLPELGRAQLTAIADRSKEFEQYLIEVLGKDEGDMAYEEQARADQFSANTEPKAKQRATGYGMSSSLARSDLTTRKKGKGSASEPMVTSSEDEDDELSPSDDDEGDEGEGEDKDSDSTEQAEGNQSDDSDSVNEEKVKAMLELMRKQKKKKKGKK
ncbi:hypothetical protein PG999_012444 [Apiospora kogelbergensis]|uniref:AAA+ ATPase domain-containing protein n=1 Tax=Apiospora kogelbergensis TaxID=1337665 RepID=A0AAW0Q6V6_9PEZI